jgi:hypothetical protein
MVPHHIGNQDPHPHQIKIQIYVKSNLDPDPHQSDKLDPNPHQIKIRIRIFLGFTTYDISINYKTYTYFITDHKTVQLGSGSGQN